MCWAYGLASGGAPQLAARGEHSVLELLAQGARASRPQARRLGVGIGLDRLAAVALLQPAPHHSVHLHAHGQAAALSATNLSNRAVEKRKKVLYVLCRCARGISSTAIER